jgi:hypothetical protein
MSVQTLLAALRNKLGGQVPHVLLSSGKPTGEKPCEMFDTEEQAEHYLTLKTSDEQLYGGLTGAAVGVGGLAILAMGGICILDRDWEGLLNVVIAGVPLAIIPFLWEIRKPLPLPILFNRRTREVYFDVEGELYHSPWDSIAGIAYQKDMYGPYTGKMRGAALEILVHRLGVPEQQLMLSLGAPMGKTIEMQLGFWEWLRAYMNNGPWFDEDGNHSESDAFVKSQLAIRAHPRGRLKRTFQRIAEQYHANGGKNFLGGPETFALVGDFVMHPMTVIQDLMYKFAKRRSRNRWPDLVLERLRPDGPSTRLVDLERERGLDVQ